jgi:hypothetical protein
LCNLVAAYIQSQPWDPHTLGYLDYHYDCYKPSSRWLDVHIDNCIPTSGTLGGRQFLRQFLQGRHSHSWIWLLLPWLSVD